MNKKSISDSIYNPKAKRKNKINPLREIYPPLPNEKYNVIYADPTWDYGGKMQYDKSSIKEINIDFQKEIFISAANFQYPTLSLKALKELDVKSISANDCILFLWTTDPQLKNAIVRVKLTPLCLLYFSHQTTYPSLFRRSLCFLMTLQTPLTSPFSAKDSAATYTSSASREQGCRPSWEESQFCICSSL